MFSVMISRSSSRWPSVSVSCHSAVSASTNQARMSWPSRMKRVLASEQSPQ